jgi:hypothetical protein
VHQQGVVDALRIERRGDVESSAALIEANGSWRDDQDGYAFIQIVGQVAAQRDIHEHETSENARLASTGSGGRGGRDAGTWRSLLVLHAVGIQSRARMRR